MKRLSWLLALALALGLGYAQAQNITRSLQGSQDPRGPVGIDTSNFMYFPQHVNPGTTSVGPTSGNGATFVGVATDNAGIVSLAVATGTSIAFAIPFNQTPACVVAANGTSASVNPQYTVTTSLLTINTVAAVNSQFAYLCFGNK